MDDFKQGLPAGVDDAESLNFMCLGKTLDHFKTLQQCNVTKDGAKMILTIKKTRVGAGVQKVQQQAAESQVKKGG